MKGKRVFESEEKGTRPVKTEQEKGSVLLSFQVEEIEGKEDKIQWEGRKKKAPLQRSRLPWRLLCVLLPFFFSTLIWRGDFLSLDSSVWNLKSKQFNEGKERKDAALFSLERTEIDSTWALLPTLILLSFVVRSFCLLLRQDITHIGNIFVWDRKSDLPFLGREESQVKVTTWAENPCICNSCVRRVSFFSWCHSDRVELQSVTSTCLTVN